MKDVLSTRLSIRKRGESLGHHQAIETQERFSSWRSEEFSKLVWTLGAMAAEHVFYRENSTGVGGDVMSATARAAWMVGMCAMGPNPIDLGERFATAQDESDEREKLLRRFEDIGVQIMNRAGTGGPFDENPIAAVLGDRDKRKSATVLLGQAYVTAYVTIAVNRDRVDRIAEKLIQRKEMHGDEVVELLDSVDLVRPKIDLLDEATWPPV
jgi:ATP-dependent Zn protease